MCARRGRRTAYLTDEASESAKLPYGGALDLDTGLWADLPDLPGLDYAREDLEKARGGGTVAVHNGWAYDPVRRVWIELPGLPGHLDRFASAIWAGDRALVFANVALEPLDRDGFETRPVRVRDGWAWRTPA